MGEGLNLSSGVSEDEIGETALDFINSALLQGQSTATLNGVTIENGLFKLMVNVQGQETPIYVTQDGTLMFLNAIPMTEVTGATTTDNTQQTQASPDVRWLTKSSDELTGVRQVPNLQT
jgi:hypothetical protein